jgi:predicted nucleic acid-binding Zn ribbon protein
MKKNDVSLREALTAMLREFKLAAPLNEARVKSLWPEIMGKTIATYTTGVEVRRQVLYVTILSAPLRQELSYSKEKIKDRLNEELGENFIKDVVIQ